MEEIVIKYNSNVFTATRNPEEKRWHVEFKLRSGIKGSFRTPEKTGYAKTALAQACFKMTEN